MSVHRVDHDRGHALVSLALPRLRARVREVNRRIAATAPGNVAALACECESRTCEQAFEVPLAVFHVVDARPPYALVGVGHERPDERIVRRGAGYVVVAPPPPAAD
jgi:hypothetical protein